MLSTLKRCVDKNCICRVCLKKKITKSRKKNITIKISVDYARQEFALALEHIENLVLNDGYTKAEHLSLLEDIAEWIRRDIQADFMHQIIYSEVTPDRGFRFVPWGYYDESGQYQELQCIDETHTIDFSQDCIITFPWNSSKIAGAFVNLKNKEFVYHENNHFAYAYNGIDIVHVHNGIHSSSVGVYKKQGVIQGKLYDIIPLFRHICTDGKSWLNAHTNEVLDDVYDWRIGLLFEVCRWKHEIID